MNTIHNLPFVVFRLDASGNFVLLNDAWKKLTGLSIQAVRNQCWLNFIHEQDRAAVASKFEQIRTQKTTITQTFECHLTTQNSLPLCVETHITPIIEDSCIKGFSGSFYELTAIKRTLNELRQNQQRLSWALQGANDGYWDWDVESDLVYYSPRWRSMLGYDENELLEPHLDTWKKLTNPNDMERVLKHASDYFSGRVPKYEIEFQMKHKDGHWVDILSRASFARDANGDLISPKRLIGTHVDITERKKTELKLEILNIALESVANAMVITDPQSVIEWANPAFLKLTGYTLEEALGNKMKNLVYSGLHDDIFFKTMWQTISANKVWQGEVINKKKNGVLYDAFITITPVTDQFDRIQYFIAVKEDITQRKASEKEIRDLAFYDPLTKLPNRRLFLEQLTHAMLISRRERNHSALLFIDLDNFKTLNDTHGHDIGDMFLTKVASQIRHCIRNKDIVARLGGDEFVVMLEQLAKNAQIAITETTITAKKILEVLKQEYSYKEIQYRGSASIGICMFMDQYERAEDILKRADTAMYEAKNAGRNALRFFDPVMQQALEQKIRLEKELWAALERQEFKFYYQLQINNEQEIIGIEALLRWHHPQKGILSPDDFLPCIEQNGMIIPIGDWAMSEGLSQLHQWQQTELFHSITLSFNISAIQFQKEDFVSKLKMLIQQFEIDCSKLFLELTESTLIQDHDNMIGKINELSAMGIRFSIDDFGTGYSSLSYLKRFNLSQIKIDRMFVRDILNDPDDLTLVKTIIDMGKNLGLDLIAEGVENQQQFEVLKSSGCVKYQGYWVSRPMSADGILASIMRHNQSRELLDETK